MKRLKLFFAALTAAVLSATLTSCAGTEPNDVAYVVGIGFDNADDGSYIITIQYARPTQISGGSSEEGGKSGSDIVENLAVEAPNLYAGLEIANHTESKRFSLSHAKLIVFSAETAKNGISEIMETIARNEEIRPDIYLAVAEDSAREYLFSVKPSVEVNPAKYYQLIYQGESKQAVPLNSALAVYFNYKNGNRDNVLPLAGVSQKYDSGGGEGAQSEGGSSEGETADPEKTQNDKQQLAPRSESGFEFRLRDYIAGESSVNNSNKSEAVGMVVFKGDKAQLVIGSIEEELYRILTGDFTETYLTLESDTGDAVTLKVEQERAPRYTIDKNRKIVDISLSLESNLYSMPASYVSEDDINAFEEKAKGEIESACERFISDVVKANGADVLGFCGKVKPSVLTNGEYEQIRGEVMSYEVGVSVDFVIRRTGLTVWED